jgi:hypothetical protein
MEVYIVLTHTGTLFTRFIRFVTKQPLNHASISFKRELDATFSFGRKKPNNPYRGGFVKEDLKGKLFRNADCAIYRCSVSRSQFVRMRRFVQEIESNSSAYKYNLIGLLGIVMNRTIDIEQSYFCSQFVAAVLSSGGITIKDKPACLVRPSDFMDHNEFQLVYEGKLSQFLEIHGQHKERLTGTEGFYLLPS